MSLTDEEIARYGRHFILKGFGGPGQNALKNACVLIVGAGGLGSPVIAYLAAAGVGKMIIMDDDEVSLSNLQRQIIHRDDNLGAQKVQSAQEFVVKLNPHVQVHTMAKRAQDGPELRALISNSDVVLDGTDNFGTRKMLARLCGELERPLVSGAVNMFDGQLTVFAPYEDDDKGNPLPRFEDLYPLDMDEGDFPRCEDVGVLGASVGVIGSLMAMETIKLIAKVGKPLKGRLLIYDGRNGKFDEFAIARKG